jgi:hypothetical protein
MENIGGCPKRKMNYSKQEEINHFAGVKRIEILISFNYPGQLN